MSRITFDRETAQSEPEEITPSALEREILDLVVNLVDANRSLLRRVEALELADQVRSVPGQNHKRKGEVIS